ncbi:MAG: hypothetical protein HRU14_09000 [Planctomycetes bacterium]|nr:hypothetical protein [Planctomycetota bacterium]
MEKHVFTDERVREAFRKFVVVKLYCDQKYGPTANDRADFNTELEKTLTPSIQQPQYVVLDPETREAVATWGWVRAHLGNPQLFVDKMLVALQAVKDF